MFSGSMVAIVTPFKNGKVDEKSLGDLIEFQIANGTNGIVPCGTTGESATLTHKEHDQVVRIVVEAAKGRVPVIAGTGSNSTAEAISLTKDAKEAGADAALLITPYYNKPTQEGLFQHFKAVADAVDIPVFLYNVPGRTAVNMLPKTIARASEIKNIVGVKEACGDISQISEVVRLTPDDFIVLSGDDSMTWPIIAVGGKGVISVLANILPGPMAKLCSQGLAGNIEEVNKLHLELLTISDAMFYETNPIPVKTALSLMGKISDELRAPLCPMGKDAKDKLVKVLKDYKII